MGDSIAFSVPYIKDTAHEDLALIWGISFKKQNKTLPPRGVNFKGGCENCDFED